MGQLSVTKFGFAWNLTKGSMVHPRGLHKNHKFQRAEAKPSNFNAPYSPIGYTTDFQLLEPGQTKENAANLAGFNGAKDVVEGVCIFEHYIALFPILATHWGALV